MKIKLSTSIIITIFLIVFLTIFFLIKFNQKVTPNIFSITNASINKLNETILTNYRVKDLYQELDLLNAISLSKNKEGEIISVDFDLETIYTALSALTVYLQNALQDNDDLKQILSYYDEYLSVKNNALILSIPIGNNYPYLASLGPKIPVSIKYLNYVASNVRINLTDYGINNVLISIYIDIQITNEFIIPSSNKTQTNSYSILVSSKIIKGSVPDYYGGVMERQSSILNIPLS